MKKIRKCEFNMDTACVELVFDDGTVIAYSTPPTTLARLKNRSITP